MKLNSLGNISWSKTFVGANNDMGSAIQQTSDGGYIVAGGSTSFGSGDVDLLIIKLEADGSMTGDCPIQDCSVTTTSPTVIVTSPTLTVYSPSLIINCSLSTSIPAVIPTDICGPAGIEENKKMIF
ncbi:MAG: hypothetical protein HY769_02665 [Candidatus Stahlbacteria bacterium]|nr:hypothetical protein [Candidatus Stahlbacteria bacterium]